MAILMTFLPSKNVKRGRGQRDHGRNFDYFRPSNFDGMTMEIIFDACRKKDFQAMEKAAFGLPIQSEQLGKIEP